MKEQELKPCPDYLRSLFHCFPSIGELTWKAGKGRRNGEAGSLDSKGRLRVEIDGKSYAVASVIWAIHYRSWPKCQLDHENRIRTDNRINNLREATNQQNSFNRQRHKGKSLPKGVSLHKGRYTSRISVSGKTINLGSFDTPESAAEAYRLRSELLHGEFACHE